MSTSEKQQPGYVYILTNPSFKEDWVKIGKSSRPVEVRSAELDNTAVPLPFEIYATIKTVKYHDVERMIHKSIDRISNLRIRQNREFFNIAPATATDMLVDIAKLLGDAEVCRYEKNEPYQIYPIAKTAYSPCPSLQTQHPPHLQPLAQIAAARQNPPHHNPGIQTARSGPPHPPAYRSWRSELSTYGSKKKRQTNLPHQQMAFSTRREKDCSTVRP